MNSHSMFSVSNSSSDCVIMPDSTKVYYGIYRVNPRDLGRMLPRPKTPSLPNDITGFLPSSAPTSNLVKHMEFRPMTPPLCKQ